MKRLCCVVEGHGEVTALPVLVRRITQRWAPDVVWRMVEPVIRQPRGALLRQGGLEAAVRLAALKGGSGSGILVVLDADEDCPAKLGPALLARARSARADHRIEVVLAKREYESWLAASAESLSGRRNVRAGAARPPDPERVGKAWIEQHLDGKYSETIDQEALTRLLDPEAARSVDSFDKLVRSVCGLLDITSPPRALVPIGE